MHRRIRQAEVRLLPALKAGRFTQDPQRARISQGHRIQGHPLQSKTPIHGLQQTHLLTDLQQTRQVTAGRVTPAPVPAGQAVHPATAGQAITTQVPAGPAALQATAVQARLPAQATQDPAAAHPIVRVAIPAHPLIAAHPIQVREEEGNN